MYDSSLKVSAHKCLFFFALLLFRGVMDLSYGFVISEAFMYEGFLMHWDVGQYTLSWIIYLISFGFVSDRVLKVGDYFFAVALLSVVAPLSTMYGLDAEKPVDPLLVTVFALYIIYYISRLGIFSLKKLPVVVGGRFLAVCISLLFVVFLVFWFVASGARPNLDFTQVYEFREANAELTAKGIFAYTNNWTFQVFSIYLISVALFYRKYLFVALLLLVQVYFFSIASHRSILFIPFLVFGSWMYFRYSNSLLVLPVALALIILASIVSYYAFDDVWLSSLMSRRVFFVPANLSFVYFDFFGFNPHVYWSNSILSAFSTYPYGDLGVPYVVGEYMGREGMGANNGFVSSGFAHAGVYGVLFYATIIGLIVRLINDVTVNNMPIWIAVAISVVPLRSILISSDLFTVMLTHGFGIALVLIYLSRTNSVSSDLGYPRTANLVRKI
ncbi:MULTISPECIES: hypothetical protein [unclassified Pseudomonas]|uniref:hypothetical protein n=1 Tax=unclassified Pseudomonas TaxID=196821 RepID=UPI001E02DB1B|nr:hypothetical protein [Pseudomonas sp.]MPT00092.1 hypothetical protein [Pseudomonas sp.]